MYSTETTPTTFREIYRQPVLTTGPTLSVLEVAELKGVLNVEHDEKDVEIQGFIDAAIKLTEDYTERGFLTQTWTLYLDSFPDWGIELRRAPVASVTSVVYLDSNGDSQTLSASLYRTDLYGLPSRITPAYGQVWPVTYPVVNAVTITFVVGNTSRAAVSPVAKQAIRMLVGHWWKHRETVVATGAVPQELSLAYGACVESLSWSGRL